LTKRINDISLSTNSDQHVSVPSQSEAPGSSSDDARDDTSQSISIESGSKNPAKKSKLSSNDFEEEIIMGNELSDLHINKAQSLLKAQFPQVNGLISSLLQSKDLQPTGSVSNKIQIVHCSKRHHWVVATTVDCKDGEVIVFDSVYRSLDDETKATVSRLFQNGSELKIKVVNPQIQKGGNDCGLFATAYATAIAFHQFPVKKTFRQESMRARLVTCFKLDKILPFP